MKHKRIEIALGVVVVVVLAVLTLIGAKWLSIYLDVVVEQREETAIHKEGDKQRDILAGAINKVHPPDSWTQTKASMDSPKRCPNIVEDVNPEKHVDIAEDVKACIDATYWWTVPGNTSAEEVEKVLSPAVNEAKFKWYDQYAFDTCQGQDCSNESDLQAFAYTGDLSLQVDFFRKGGEGRTNLKVTLSMSSDVNR